MKPFQDARGLPIGKGDVDASPACGQACTNAGIGAVSATFNGVDFMSQAGISIAAALLHAGWTTWRHSPTGQARGMYCGIGVCHECAITVNGAPGIRACMVPIEQGMRLTSGECEEQCQHRDGRIGTAGDAATNGGEEDGKPKDGE